MNHNTIKTLFIFVLALLIFSQGLPAVNASNDLTHCVFSDQDDEIICQFPDGPDVLDDDFIEQCQTNNPGENDDIAYINSSEPLNFDEDQWNDYDKENVANACGLDAIGCDCDNPQQGFVPEEDGLTNFYNIYDVTADTCVAFCGISEEIYTLSGTARNNETDEVIEGVDITVQIGGVVEDSVTTNENGEYAIDLSSNNYSVTASINACEVNADVEITDSDRQVNFRFPEECVSDDLPDEDDSDPVDDFPGIGGVECGDPDFEIEYSGDCIPGEPPEFMEGYEDCENHGNYVGGNLYCTDSCTVNTDSCLDEPSDDEELVCSTDGEFDMDRLSFSYSVINNAPGFNITLFLDADSECKDDGLEYSIDKCVFIINEEGESICLERNEVFSGNLNNQRQHTDINPFGIDGDEVCYYVSVNNGEDEKEQCVSKPVDFCSDKLAGSYCDGDEIVTCDDSGLVEDREGCDGRCGESMVDGDPVGYCLADDALMICDMCNGLFGLHAHQNNLGGDTYEVQVGDITREISSCVYEFDASQNPLGGICYADSYTEGLLSTASFDLCPDVNSCYDYKAQGSCEANPCDNSLAQNCEWNELSPDLGTGVCAPQEAELLECERCDEDDRNCTENFCAAHGDECYYTESQYFFNNNLKSCISPNNHACEMYNTEQDCLGEVEYDAEIHYGGEDNERFGNHTRTQLSNDKFNLGACRWNSDSDFCERDAALRLKFGSISPDCSPGDLDCLTDFEKPRTKITNINNGGAYSSVQLSELSYLASDNTFITGTVPGLVTRFITEKTSDCQDRTFMYNGQEYCYPTLNYDDFSSGLDFVEPGLTRLFYFTSDGAHNFEQIQSLQFRIVKKLEDVMSGSTNVEYRRVSTGFIADIDFGLNVETSSNYPENQISCDIQLHKLNDENIGESDLIRQFDTTFTQNFNYVFDSRESGTYNIEVSCEDSYDQVFTDEFTVDVDSNNILREVKPRGLVYNPGQEININLTTLQPAECEYTLDQTVPLHVLEGDPFSFPGDYPELDTVEWESYETNNNLHSANVTLLSTEGIFKIVPRCHFEVGTLDFTYYGLNPNMVYYAIDDTSPTVQVMHGGEEYDSSQAREGLILHLNVTDLPTLTRENSNKIYNHGVDTVEYCVIEQGENCDFETYDGTTIQVDPPSTPINKFLRVRVADKGGNSLTTNTFLNLTNSDFEPPTVEICEGDTCYGKE